MLWEHESTLLDQEIKAVNNASYDKRVKTEILEALLKKQKYKNPSTTDIKEASGYYCHTPKTTT